MPTWAVISGWFVQNGAWTITAKIISLLVASGLTTLVFDRAFGLLTRNRQKIWFLAGMVALGGLIIGLFSANGPYSHLKGNIAFMGLRSEEPVIAVALAAIANDGQIQTTITSLSIVTTVDMRQYVGIPTAMPEKVTLNTANGAVTYYSTDSLLTKVLTPIPVGGSVNGVVMFVFPDAPATVLMRPSTYTISFNDVFGKPYQMSIDTIGKATLPAIGLPGVRQDFSPIPAPTTTQGAPQK
jgi:hypothetical protein